MGDRSVLNGEGGGHVSRVDHNCRKYLSVEIFLPRSFSHALAEDCSCVPSPLARQVGEKARRSRGSRHRPMSVGSGFAISWLFQLEPKWLRSTVYNLQSTFYSTLLYYAISCPIMLQESTAVGGATRRLTLLSYGA